MKFYFLPLQFDIRTNVGEIIKNGKVVGILCQFGAWGDLADKAGRTALQETALLGDAEVLKVFIENSSDLDVPDKLTGGTPLIEGIRSENSSKQDISAKRLET